MTLVSVDLDVTTDAERRWRSEVCVAAAGGARAMLPWLVGVVPYGVVIGVTISAGTVDTATGVATGPAIYSGSAQLAALDMLERSATPAVAVATVLALNARLAFYSGGMAPHWRGTSRRFRLLAAALLVDPSYAVGRAGYAEHGAHRGHRHYLGAALTLFVAWHAAIVTGLLVGSGVPEGLHLEHAVPLFLVAEVARSARTRPAVLAAAVGGLVAVSGSGLPLHAGPLAGIGAGIAAGRVASRRSGR